MISRTVLPAAVFALVSSAAAQPAAPPEKALKYHEALIKRPANAQLFDRFFGAWIDEQPVDTLGAWLTARAAQDGGPHWTILAKYQLRRGDEAAALTSLGKALAAAPGDQALSMERAKLLMRRMDFNAARMDLTTAAKGGDEAVSLEAGKLIGRSWLREGKSEEAVKAWDAVLAAHPADEDLLEDLVETAAAEGATAQALAYAEKLIAATTDPYRKTLRSLRRGDLLAQAGRTDDAAAAYTATLADVGEASWLEREIIAQIVKLYRKQDRLDDLASELGKLADANPRRLLIHRELAKLEAAQGNVDAAVGRFREVLKRSPGERELREEFVRLLADGEKFDEAAEEMEKLVAASPQDGGLLLQLASLRQREGKKDAALAALEKARVLLGGDESAGLRVSSLMFQYGLDAKGEDLLKQLAAAPEAGPAPAEALAAYYGRVNRKPEAIELLKKAAAGPDVDALIRVAGSISALGEQAAAYDLLASRAATLTEPRFLAAFAQAALAAAKPADAIPPAMRLVKTAAQTTELADAIGLASRAITSADKVADWRTSLNDKTDRSVGETCLLATLAESQQDSAGVSALLDRATDPLAVHFHAALLDKRGDFPAAIAALSRLADTPEGRKAAYFKDLAALQQRAGKTTEALATVERWKQSAPGDKTAWTTGIQLQRGEGKLDDAIRATRQAAARFEGDADLTALLATLMDDAGQTEDAETVYWRLYDDAQAPADQARWAAQLARLAVKSGRTDVLEEKLNERAKGNRRSLGPVLARAELARVMEDDEKRRDLLLEAVRLQPKDVDLRLQIATLEENSGELDRAVAVLEEAAAIDTTGRARSALAQAYIRQGQTLKGLRELRTATAAKSGDPRAAEQTAAALAGANLYEEAIGFLREDLPDGGDWRSKYLLAVLLEEDGREREAVPVFLSLLQAVGEIESLKKNQPQSNQPVRPDPRSEKTRDLQELWQASRYAYIHKQRERTYYGPGGSAMTGPFKLPETPQEVRDLAIFHLCKLTKTDDAALAGRVKDAGVGNFPFLRDFAAAAANERSPDFKKLLTAYPEETGLAELILSAGRMSGGGENGLSSAEARKLLETIKDLSPQIRLQGWIKVAAEEKPADGDKAWDELLAAAREVLAAKTDGPMGYYTRYQLIPLVTGAEAGGEGMPKLPAAKGEALKKELTATILAEKTEDPDLLNIRLASLAMMKMIPEWITAANQATAEFRKKPGTAGALRFYSRGGVFSQFLQYARNSRQFSGYDPFGSLDVFQVPEISDYPLVSLHPYVSAMVVPADPPPARRRTYGFSYRESGIPAADLAKQSAAIASPVFRAWIALAAKDDAAAEKILATDPPPAETADFIVLRALRALKAGKNAEAFALLGTAPTGSDRDFTAWVDVTRLAIAAKMTAPERTAAEGELNAVFTRCRQSFGPATAGLFAKHAEKLDLADLAKRLAPPIAPGKAAALSGGPAGFRGSSRSGSQPQAAGSIDKVKNFTTEKKHAAAAREAMLVLKQMRSGNYNGSSSDEAKIPAILGEDGCAEVLKLVEPGASNSLVKCLEYADVCRQLGMPEKALPVMERLLAERPDNAAIAARVVFFLPPERAAERAALMTRAARDESFTDIATVAAKHLHNAVKDPAKVIGFYESLTGWLEKVDPAALEGANLSWINYYGKEFFDSMRNVGFSDLGNEEEVKKSATDPVKQRRVEIAKRLATAMTRIPATAEAGFRLLSHSKAWALAPEEADQLARAVIASAGIFNEYGLNNVFMLRTSRGGSSSGDDLDEKSSVAWLLKRLDQGAPAATLFPADWIAAVTKTKPARGKILATLANLKSTDQLREFWQEKEPTTNDPIDAALRSAVITRAAKLPGGTALLLEGIAKIKANDMRTSGRLGASSRSLLAAALAQAAALDDEKEREKLCRALAKAIYGESPKWDDPQAAQELQQRGYIIYQLLQDIRLEPTPALRLAGTLFRLKIPIGPSEYVMEQHLRRATLKSAEEAEARLTAAGLLTGPASWNPPSVWVFENQPAKPSLVAKSIGDSLLGSYSFSRSDLTKRLKERKDGRFGALLAAAEFTSGSERSTLAAQAFTDAAAEVVKLPAEKISALKDVVAMISPPDFAKLPAAVRTKLAGLNKERDRETIAAIEEFLKSDRYNGSSERLMEQAARIDPALALKMLLKTDELASTNSSSSNYTSNGFEVNRRDSALGDLFDGDDLAKDPDTALRFLAKLSACPEAGRFAFAPYYTSGSQGGGWFAAGAAIINQTRAAQKPGDKLSTAVAILAAAAGREEDIRQNAIAAAAGSLLYYDHYQSVLVNPAERKKTLATLQFAPPETARYATIIYGLRHWKKDDAAAHKATMEALAALLADEGVSLPLRRMIAFTCAAICQDLIEEPAATAAILPLYEGYCAEDRSAVNGWAGTLFRNFANSAPGAEGKKTLRRYLAAFWGNANAAKVGGHAPIPPSLTADLLAVSILAGDDAGAAKLFARVSGDLSGDLRIATILVTAGNYDLAKRVMPAKGAPFKMERGNAIYTRALEEKLDGFRAALSDPQMALRFEAALLRYDNATGPAAPKTSLPARALALAKRCHGHLPADRAARVEILTLITKGNQLAALELAPELAEIGKSIDYRESLRRWENDPDEEINGVEGHVLSQTEGDLLAAAALATMASGDTALLDAMTKALCDAPILQKSSDGYTYRGDTPYVVKSAQDLFIARAAFWMWICAAHDQTAGFPKALDAFEALALNADKRFEFDDSVNSPLAICQFLTMWTGQPQRFDALKAKMTSKQAKGFPAKPGLQQLLNASAKFGGWDKPFYFPAIRKDALRKILARPGFPATVIEKSSSWVEWMAGKIPTAELEEYARQPDDAIPQLLRPTVLEYLGKRLAAQKKPADAAAAFRRALTATPADPPWNDLRGWIKVALAEQLLAANQTEDAKQITAAIRPEELSSPLKARFQKITTSLGLPDAGTIPAKQ